MVKRFWFVFYSKLKIGQFIDLLQFGNIQFWCGKDVVKWVIIIEYSKVWGVV